MSAGGDNAAAAANLNNSFSGLRDFLYKRSVQAPLLAEQVKQAQQNTALGSNQVTLSGISTKQAENAAHLGTFAADLDAPDPDAPQSVPDTRPQPSTPTPVDSGLTNSVLSTESPEDSDTASTLAAALPAGTTSGQSSTPVVPNSLKFGTSYFQELPTGLQTKVLKQYALSTPHPELLKMDDVINSYNQHVTQTKLPPVNPYTIGRFGLGITGAESGPEGTKFSYAANPGQAVPILNPDGTPSGKMRVNGTVADDPSFVPPEKIAGMMGDYANVQNAQSLAGQVTDILDNHPEIYGMNAKDALKGKGGTFAGNLGANARALMGDPTQKTLARALDQQQIKGVLDTLSQIHIGRVTEMEWKKLSDSVPQTTDSKETWHNWNNRFKNAIGATQSGLEGILGPAGKLPNWSPSSSTTLPPVTPAASVAPPSASGRSTEPGSASGGPTVASSQAEVDKMPSGKHFIWNGKPYIKN